MFVFFWLDFSFNRYQSKVPFRFLIWFWPDFYRFQIWFWPDFYKFWSSYNQISMDFLMCYQSRFSCILVIWFWPDFDLILDLVLTGFWSDFISIFWLDFDVISELFLTRFCWIFLIGFWPDFDIFQIWFWPDFDVFLVPQPRPNVYIILVIFNLMRLGMKFCFLLFLYQSMCSPKT